MRVHAVLENLLRMYSSSAFNLMSLKADAKRVSLPEVAGNDVDVETHRCDPSM
jgi:hypothetical protein